MPMNPEIKYGHKIQRLNEPLKDTSEEDAPAAAAGIAPNVGVPQWPRASQTAASAAAVSESKRDDVDDVDAVNADDDDDPDEEDEDDDLGLFVVDDDDDQKHNDEHGADGGEDDDDDGEDEVAAACAGSSAAASSRAAVSSRGRLQKRVMAKCASSSSDTPDAYFRRLCRVLKQLQLRFDMDFKYWEELRASESSGGRLQLESFLTNRTLLLAASPQMGKTGAYAYAIAKLREKWDEKEVALRQQQALQHGQAHCAEDHSLVATKFCSACGWSRNMA